MARIQGAADPPDPFSAAFLGNPFLTARVKTLLYLSLPDLEIRIQIFLSCQRDNRHEKLPHWGLENICCWNMNPE
jgi:SpoVK/Ycf46/Vps4 family AAA+-type ATPase